jgi:hypothetical protein
LIIGFSGIAAFLFNKPFTDLYSSFIAAQSILVGFGFNVLIYFASSDTLMVRGHGAIEDKAKVKKLNQLSGEIFSNLSYFNMVALLSIFVSLVIIGGNAASFDGKVLISGLDQQWQTKLYHYGSCAENLFRILLIWVAYATVLESLATFVRLVRRVTYFFKEKRKVTGSKPSL